jgi:hypothetical protein
MTAIIAAGSQPNATPNRKRHWATAPIQHPTKTIAPAYTPPLCAH